MWKFSATDIDPILMPQLTEPGDYFLRQVNGRLAMYLSDGEKFHFLQVRPQPGEPGDATSVEEE